MKAALVDTNILSQFFRGHPQVVGKFEAYLKEYGVRAIIRQGLFLKKFAAARLRRVFGRADFS